MNKILNREKKRAGKINVYFFDRYFFVIKVSDD